MPDPEAGFALTPEQEIYYERHREEFEEALSEAMCNVIERKEEDPIEGMIRALG